MRPDESGRPDADWRKRSLVGAVAVAAGLATAALGLWLCRDFIVGVFRNL